MNKIFLHLLIEKRWLQFNQWLQKEINKIINASKFDKIFGYLEDKFLTYIFLILKYYIYICKFQNRKSPHFQGSKNYFNNK